MRNIYIIGGGVSGLNTARELAKKGENVILFEAKDQLGGLAGSINFFNMDLDLGPHIYHSPDPDIVEYLKASFPDKFHEREHYSKNYKGGKYYDYPISKDFINDLPKETAKKIHSELEAIKSNKKPTNALTYYDYITAIAGPTLRELFFTVYPKKLWGIETNLLDANWAPKRVHIKEKRQGFYSGQWAAVGNNGSKTIIDELQKHCIKQGVAIELSNPVLELKTNKERITEIITKNKSYAVRASDLVINTLPITRISPILNFNTPKLTYRGVTLVYFLLDKPNVFPIEKTDFVYIDDPEILFNRISDQNSFIKEPYKDKTVACCEITYSIGDELDEMSISELKKKAKRDILSLKFFDEESIKGIEIIKIPEVYPMFTLGYRDKINEFNSKLNKFTNLYTTGSLAEFQYSDLQILFAKSKDLADLITSKTTQLNRSLNCKGDLNFKNEFEILGQKVGGRNPCFLIAEIGLNHNGNLRNAKKLIEIAKNVGFDAVKFQTYKSEGRSSAKGKTSKYAEKVLGIEETDFEMFQKNELSFQDHIKLHNFARRLEIPFFSAPFDIDSAELLNKLGVDAFKLASMEITNHELIQYVASLGKPMIISTGMANYSEIEEALKICGAQNNNEVALLQCTSSYPAPAEAINLKAIQTMEMMFKIPVGFSDHYHLDTLSVASIALGAKIIEKHVTLDKNMEGPDHALSLDPKEQYAFVKAIREVEKALGDGIKKPHKLEYNAEIKYRKSFYFKKDMKKGEIIKESDLVLKAPLFGLLPKYKEFIVGSLITKKVYANDPVTYDVIR